MGDEKPIYWIGSSYKDLLNFPAEAKQDTGYQLHRIQNGFNPFQSIGVGVKEIRISDSGIVYRIM